VDMTELIFVNPGVKVNGQYYCDVLLSQQMLPAIKRVAGRTLFIHKTICCLRRNWSFFVFCDFPR